MVNRCRWVPTDNKLYCDYHDKEWGKPIGDDEKLFELLCLESYQSGLSWLTVLKKRQAFNRVFHNYDISRVAQFSLSELEEALQNPDVIRHKPVQLIDQISTGRHDQNCQTNVHHQFGLFLLPENHDQS